VLNGEQFHEPCDKMKLEKVKQQRFTGNSSIFIITNDSTNKVGAIKNSDNLLQTCTTFSYEIIHRKK
jgi:hypothetical protein